MSRVLHDPRRAPARIVKARPTPSAKRGRKAAGTATRAGERKPKPGGPNAWFAILRNFVTEDFANHEELPDLSNSEILAWADAHEVRFGEWPAHDSGAVVDAPGESWMMVEAALSMGLRGLPGGSSLARLLQRERGVRNKQSLPTFDEREILAWADAFRRSNGEFPTRNSGPIRESPGDTWMAVNSALANGGRGLPGGTSLAGLLAKHRGRRNIQALRDYTVGEILAWADAHYQRTGKFPVDRSGPVIGASGETWMAADMALRYGKRGLPGGTSLAQLLEQHRGVRNIHALPPLTIPKILAWADAHHRRTGRFPGCTSGQVVDAGGETWSAVDVALRSGRRGLKGGSSLAQLFADERGVRNRKALPCLTEVTILDWAYAHFARHARWPGILSGAITEAPGETWSGVNAALRDGNRGLPSGSSLAKLLDRHRRNTGGAKVDNRTIHH